MLLGEVPPKPEIPCTTCGHFLALQNSGDWLTETEIKDKQAKRAPYMFAIVPQMVGPNGMDKIEVGVSLATPGEISFFSFSKSRSVFRLGVDRAVYVYTDKPETFTLLIRMPSDTRIFSRRLEVHARPLCQELVLPLFDVVTPVTLQKGISLNEWLPLSIQ
jgi:hypothetical protein